MDLTDIIYSNDYINILIQNYVAQSERYQMLFPESSALLTLNSQYSVLFLERSLLPENLFGEILFTGLPKLFTPLSTLSLEVSGIVQTQNLYGGGYTGKNVILGFLDTGIDYRAVNKLFFQTKSRVRMQLEATMLAEAKFYDNNRTAVLSVPQSLLEKFHATESDAEDLSALGPQIQGVDCAVTMRELGDGVWKFSLRTGERVNATEVCRLLGGGGHARAAGATLEGVTQAEAEGKMLNAIARIVPDFKK